MNQIKVHYIILQYRTKSNLMSLNKHKTMSITGKIIF